MSKPIPYPSLVWQAVLNPPEGMEGWACYRIEYGFEGSLPEGTLWLPPWVSREQADRWLDLLMLPPAAEEKA